MSKNNDICHNCCHNGNCSLDKKKCEEFDKLLDQLPTITGYTNEDGILVLPAECDNGDDWSDGINPKNCNLCPHISITEEEQHKQSVKIPHVCTKYNKRVLHRNQHKGQSAVIVPCGECLE